MNDLTKNNENAYVNNPESLKTSDDSVIENDSEYINLNSKINNIFCFGSETAVVNLENGEIHKLDLENGKISKNFVKGTRVIKKLNNKIAVQREKEISIYDSDLNLLNSVKLPFSIFEDEVSFSVSLDGKGFVYCINEGNSKNLYSCPIDLSDKKLLYSFSNENTVVLSHGLMR